MIADPEPGVVVSAASVREVSIKQANGRLDAPDDLISAVADRSTTLPMTAAPMVAAGQLVPHHGDPSDRMLIATGKLEGLTLAGVDRRFADYVVPLLSAG